MSEDSAAFAAMRGAARARLAGRDPQVLSAGTGIPFDAAGQTFTVASLGRTLTVAWPELTVTPAPDPWHELILLHYLDVGDGTPPTGRLMSFASLPDGMARGGGFDR